MGIEAEVPRFQFEVVALHALRLLLDVGHLQLCRRHIGVDEVVEQLVHVLCIARHTVFQYIFGIRLISQQLCYFPSEVNDSLAYLQVVLPVVVSTHRVALHIHLASQFAACGICHERTVAGIVECEYPSLLLLFLCSHGSRLLRRVGQSVEVFLIGDMQGVCLCLLQQVLRELQRQHACLLGKFSQFLLSLVVEQRTASHESVVAVVEQSLFLRSQFAVVVVYRLYPLEEFLVESHVVGVFRQYRLHLLCQGVHLVVGLRTEQVEEHRGNPRQQVVVSVLIVVNVDYRVVESWFCGIVDSLFYLFVVAPDAFEECLLVVLELYLVERHRFVRCLVLFEEWVHSFRLLNFFFFHTVCCPSSDFGLRYLFINTKIPFVSK